MKSQILRVAEWSTAILLTLVVLLLLFARAQHAGGLWRDECASLQLAEMPRIADVFKNFQRESFPAPFPLTVRAYGAVFGTSDASLRTFGFVIGVMLLAVVWVNALLLTGPPPLLALALLGLNATFLISGTSIRGYGMGSVAVLLVLGLVGRMVIDPTRPRILTALVASLLSVQFLLYNSVLLMAIATAVAIVSLLRRQLRLALAMGAICIVCALSMLPYLWPFWNESKSTVVLRSVVTLNWFWRPLGLALGNPTLFIVTLWGALFVTLIVATVMRLVITWSNKPAPECDLLLFGFVVAVTSIVFYFAFLEIIGYLPREWHFLALLSILAGAMDLLAASLCHIRWVRAARLAAVFAALIVMPIANWPKVTQRQTNLDLVAHKLEELAQPDDLIVVDPWTLGVTFNWYYHGGTRWVTVPVLWDHRVHRFDLLKEKMMSPNPLNDLGEMIAGTLRASHRVWVVGGISLPKTNEKTLPLPPAPDSQFGWNCDAYASVWSAQLGDFIQAHASRGQFIPVRVGGSVNDVEDEPLMLVEGWRE
jgi:hypothetical protein